MAVTTILFHSTDGHTRVVADCISEGLGSVPSSDVRAVSVLDVDDAWDRLHASDLIVFGTPTHIGGVSTEMQTFIEKTSGPVWLDRMWTGKLAAGFTSSAGRSGDKLHTLQRLVIFAAQMGMTWVPLHLLGGHYSSAGSENDLNRLAGYLGLMTQANIDEPPGRTPPDADRETARLFGHYLGAVAARWTAGCAALGPVPVPGHGVRRPAL
ncbi:MAG: flavodoxin family protein [Alphaproteobacteria bacterium]